jgi:hypothetical protein
MAKSSAMASEIALRFQASLMRDALPLVNEGDQRTSIDQGHGILKPCF